MKVAKAMRYGGELIAAADCDYDDFKKLIPLCPECSEPVYLRAGSDRKSSKGKPYKIPKHWSHFNSVSEEQKAACEARVSSYTEKEEKAIASKARGQRLKLLQRYFFDIYTASESGENRNQAFNMVVDQWAKGKKQKRKIKKEIRQVSRMALPPFRKALDSTSINLLTEAFFSKENLEDRKKVLKSRFVQAGHSPSFVDAKALDDKYGKLFDLDMQMHKRICAEISSFLMAKKQRDLLLSLLDLSVSMLTIMAAVSGDTKLRSVGGCMLKSNPDKIPEESAKDLAAMIVGIPWVVELDAQKLKSNTRGF